MEGLSISLLKLDDDLIELLNEDSEINLLK